MNNRSVPLKQLVEEFKLSIAYQSTDYDTIRVEVDEVSRPGLPLTGFFEHFERLRVEVLGYVEMTYLEDQTPEKRLEIFDRLFAYKIPALVISRGQQPHPECVEMAKKHNITILLAQETSSYVISNLISYLKSELAPRITRHGVLMEVYGEGIFITGESGIGKSETAVELLKRGHRLIADDAVVLKMTSSSQLTGSAPSLIRNYIELRGIGVIKILRQRYNHINFGTIMLIVDAAIVLAYAMVLGKYQSAMYSIIAMYVVTKVVDLFLYGMDNSALCLIVSDQSKTLTEKILSGHVHRGVTILEGEGAYSHSAKHVIMCVVKRTQIPEMRRLVKSVDERAFFVVTDAKNVFGKGFESISEVR